MKAEAAGALNWVGLHVNQAESSDGLDGLSFTVPWTQDHPDLETWVASVN